MPAVSGLKIGTINATSVCNKTDEILDLISDHNIDLLIITESWIKSNEIDCSVLKAITPLGFSMFSLPRQDKRGGGIVIIYKSHIDIMFKDLTSEFTAECVLCKFKLQKKGISLLAVYRPPSLSYSSFVEELNLYLSDQQINHDEISFIVGDINIKVDLANDSATKSLNSTLEETGFTQLVKFFTHETPHSKHTIDLVMTNDSDSVTSIYPAANISSFHRAVIFTVNDSPLESSIDEILHSRKWKNFNHTEFLTTMDHDFQIRNFLNIYDVDYLLELYNDITTFALDKFAPMKTSRRQKARIPYFDDEMYCLKRQRRKDERKFRKTKNKSDWDAYTTTCKEYSLTLTKKKIAYYRKTLDKADTKTLFNTCDKLMSRNKTKSKLPKEPDHYLLAQNFNKFFVEKITKIRDNIPFVPDSDEEQNGLNEDTNSLDRFNLVSEDYVKKVLINLSNKSSLLDPLPVWLLKKHMEFFLPKIVHIVNASFCSQTVPDLLKQSIVFPTLKKSNLDCNNLNNYRPISNIAFLSKVMEKIVDDQITNHMSQNDFEEIFQSGYKKGHSVETALLRILNDIYLGKERKQITALILIDLSAAFDTIDHQILFKLLENRLKIKSAALNWLISFLTQRQQSTHINNFLSSKTKIPYGIPQGTILGPKIFSLYMLPLYEIFRDRNIKYHSYADDTQFYIETTSTNLETTKSELIEILNTLKKWFDKNKLKINAEKTEIILLGTAERISIEFCNKIITSSKIVRNLGVLLDQNLSFEDHINKICSDCYLHLRNISRNRKSMDLDTCKIIINSLVLSRLSFCCTLLIDLPKKLINKLQKVQNYAAKVICLLRKFDRISHVIKQLGWMKIENFIKYRLATIVYKCLDGSAPAYLCELIQIHVPNRELRPTNSTKLSLPNLKVTLAQKSFTYLAPKLWNEIPTEITNLNSLYSFKKNLKAYYVNQN